jgi:hypothetical protein
MNNCLAQYYKTPEEFSQFYSYEGDSSKKGYFNFGRGTICYGNYRKSKASVNSSLEDALDELIVKEQKVHLPFDPIQAADNLRRELYIDGNAKDDALVSILAKLYYFVRPALSVGIRRHLQKLHFRGWDNLPFPAWPVDRTVDCLHEQLMLISLKAHGVSKIPFIWFWPEDASSCVIMTHDVETSAGRDFCSDLMDCNDCFQISSAFGLVPEERYSISPSLLDTFRKRGFEIVVHDLNHDGTLYKERDFFIKKVEKINFYGQAFGAEGFRSGALYRNQSWFDLLKFSYDMSVPNVAHLDPQRGGCCTIMPYFVGNLIEMPVTTIQDYTLFYILNDYSINLWEKQINLIIEKHGLISFIVHPDYIRDRKGRYIYEKLLGHLAELREKSKAWITTPSEVNRWWRQRNEMKLVQCNGTWKIEGLGKERARIAYASNDDDRLAISF